MDGRLWLLQAAIALLGGLLVVAFEMPSPDAGPETAVAPAPAEPAATPDGTKIVERTQAAVVAEMRAEPGGDLSSLPPFEVPAGLVSIDGTAFQRGEDAVRLDGVEGPRRDDVCRDEAGRMWACGLQARAALHNTVAGRALRCQPRRSLPGGEMAADCVIAGKEGAEANLARLLVAGGWARSAAAEAHGEQTEQARAGGLGLWRGGWSIVSRKP